MASGPDLIRLAVFGHPVAHSLSPEIHARFARQLGLAVDYGAIDAPPDGFLDALTRFAASGARGCNVTVPLKRLAWEAAARCSEEADRARAANTLVFESRTHWFADNTDGRGLTRDLHRQRPGAPGGCSLLLIGAGGAASGVLGALLQAGAGPVHIANRTPERARALAERHAGLGIVTWSGLDQLGKPDSPAAGGFDLVVQSTSAGHAGTCPDLGAGLFAPGGLCYDLNYGAAAEPLRRHCAERGIAYTDGLGMLVEQAGLSFELWTGRQPDTARVIDRLRAGLRA